MYSFLRQLHESSEHTGLFHATSSTSPAQLVYGSPLRLPGQLLPDPAPLDCQPSSSFVQDLFGSIRAAVPMPVRFHGTHRPQVPASLRSVGHVYVRVDAVTPPLSRPYVGPFPVLSRSDKVFRLLRNGKDWNVSVDRLKPAFAESLESRHSPTSDSASSSAHLPPSTTPLERQPGSPPSSPAFLPLPAPMPELAPVLDPSSPPRAAVPPSPIRPPSPAVADLPPAPDAEALDLSSDEEFPPLPAPVQTRSGRVSRPPDRFFQVQH